MTTPAAEPSLTSLTVSPGDLESLTPARLAGWFEAHARGFHGGRTSEKMRHHFRDHIDSDQVRLRGIWQERAAIGSGDIPVATYSSYDKTVNVGGGRLLPVRMVSDITVSPTHRRRGLLRRLITDDLREAVDLGLPLAVLTASEGSIYGRFGFGPATRYRTIEVDTSARFALRGLDDDGTVELVEPVEAWPAVQDVFARFHRSTRGSVERPTFYEPILTGTFDFQDGPDKKLRAAVHLDPSGQADGYVTYKPGERKDTGRPIEVQDLVALTQQAYLRIWRFLADIDLAQKVTWEGARLDDPLEWALVEPRVVTVTKVVDLLWLRVLDVVAALEARPWGADDELVLGVTDALGHAAGRFRVTTSGGRATVASTDSAAEVELDAETLGSLYLGDVSTRTLRAAGRVAGSDDDAGRWAAMADAAGPAPYCITGF